MMRSLAYEILLLLFLSGWITGCSEFKFVNQKFTDRPDDPRADIVLRNVRAEFTSGSLMQRRVKSDAAVYQETRGMLLLAAPTIESFTAEGTIEGVTNATTATMFLADAPQLKRRKGDFQLIGRVQYRAPSKSDPTTDSLILYTSSLGWINDKELFVCDAPYEMKMFVPNRAPMVAAGDQFVATRDLRVWNVKHGALGTALPTNVAEHHAKLRAELEALSAPVQTDSAEPAQPVELPSEMLQAEAALRQGESTGLQTAPNTQTTTAGRRLLRLPTTR